MLLGFLEINLGLPNNTFSVAQGLSSGPEKGEQVGIDLVFVCVGEAVRPARVDLQGRVPDEFGRSVGRSADRHDLVVVAMDDEGGHVKPQQILGEVRLGNALMQSSSLPYQGWPERPWPRRSWAMQR